MRTCSKKVFVIFENKNKKSKNLLKYMTKKLYIAKKYKKMKLVELLPNINANETLLIFSPLNQNIIYDFQNGTLYMPY
jgi:hypothetical protein